MIAKKEDFVNKKRASRPASLPIDGLTTRLLKKISVKKDNSPVTIGGNSGRAEGDPALTVGD